MNIKISFKQVLKNIIAKNKILYKFYFLQHPNNKYSIDFIIDEILYILKTGLAWRNIRSAIHWNTLYQHFRTFTKHGIFIKLFNFVKKKYLNVNKSYIYMIDSTFIFNKFGKNKIARNKFFKNKNCNKISFLTDCNGLPLSIFIDKGSKHDLSFLNNHIKDSNFIRNNNNYKILLADKAYESKEYRNILNNHNCKLMIPKKKNMTANYYFDKIIYKKRIIIENTFQKLKVFRKVFIRYDRLFSNYKSFVFLASAILVYNKL
jgi:transposase